MNKTQTIIHQSINQSIKNGQMKYNYYNINEGNIANNLRINPFSMLF